MSTWQNQLSLSSNESFEWLLGTSLLLFIIGFVIYTGKVFLIPVRVSKNQPKKSKIQQQLRFTRQVGLSSIWLSIITLLGSLSLIREMSLWLHNVFLSAFIFSILGPTIYFTQRHLK